MQGNEVHARPDEAAFHRAAQSLQVGKRRQNDVTGDTTGALMSRPVQHVGAAEAYGR
jgi:hypothetical protein